MNSNPFTQQLNKPSTYVL